MCKVQLNKLSPNCIDKQFYKYSFKKTHFEFSVRHIQLCPLLGHSVDYNMAAFKIFAPEHTYKNIAF